MGKDAEDIRNAIIGTLDALFQEDPQRGCEAIIDVATALIDHADKEALQEALKSLEPYMNELLNSSGSEIHTAM